MTQIISRDPAEVRGPFHASTSPRFSTSHITRLYLSCCMGPASTAKKDFPERSMLHLTTDGSVFQKRPVQSSATCTGDRFRYVRQPPAVYRRGPTGNTKYSVSPNQTYPYHLSTDDCWLRCVHHRRWRLIETNNTTLVGYTDWISSY